jgi:hypothetical protein
MCLRGKCGESEVRFYTRRSEPASVFKNNEAGMKLWSSRCDCADFFTVVIKLFGVRKITAK